MSHSWSWIRTRLSSDGKPVFDVHACRQCGASLAILHGMTPEDEDFMMELRDREIEEDCDEMIVKQVMEA